MPETNKKIDAIANNLEVLHSELIEFRAEFAAREKAEAELVEEIAEEQTEVAEAVEDAAENIEESAGDAVEQVKLDVAVPDSSPVVKAKKWVSI